MGWRVPDRPIKNSVIEDDIYLSDNFRKIALEVFNAAKNVVHDDKRFFEENITTYLNRFFDSLPKESLANNKLYKLVSAYGNVIAELLRQEELFGYSLMRTGHQDSALAIVYSGLAYTAIIESFYSMLTQIGIYITSPCIEDRDNIDVSIAASNALNINLIGCVEFINNQEYCDLREVISKIGNSFNVVNS